MKSNAIVLIVGLLCAFVPAVGVAQECTPDMTFVGDVTIFDGAVLRAGEHFTKVWQVKNSGTCHWTDEYAVEPVEGDRFSLDETGQPLLEEVPAGQDTYLMLTNLTAPQETGEYTSTWRLRDDAGRQLGPDMHVQIRVGAPEPGWLEYEDETHHFTLWYPPQWTIDVHEPDYVGFRIGEHVLAGFSPDHGFTTPPHVHLQLMLFDHGNSDIDVLDQGKWMDGRGTYVELEERYHVPKYNQVVPAHGLHAITLVGLNTDAPARPQREYLLAGINKFLRPITTGERQILAQVMRTFHSLGENLDAPAKPLPPEPQIELPGQK